MKAHSSFILHPSYFILWLRPNNMSDEYGTNPLLSYNKYLRVPDLINLQDCLSGPEHHDELLFITVHQAYELWFKQILHELDATLVMMREDRAAAAARAMARVVEIEKLLVNQIHILESMTPISFLAFRDQLKKAEASELKSRQALQKFATNEVEFARLQSEYNAVGIRRDELVQSRVLVGSKGVEKWQRAERVEFAPVTSLPRLQKYGWSGAIFGLFVGAASAGVAHRRRRFIGTSESNVPVRPPAADRIV